MAEKSFDQKLFSKMLGDMDSRLNSIEKNTGLVAAASKSSGEERIESARAEKIKATNDAKQTVLLEQMVKGIGSLGESMKKLANSLKEKAKAGIGMVIAGLIAPIVTIVAFFKQLSLEFAFLKKLTGGGLKKIFKPLKTFFNSEAGIGKFFSDLGKKINPKNWKWVQSLKAFFTESKAFQKSDKLWKGLKGGFTKFGTFIGKVFKPIVEMFKSIFSLGKTLIEGGKTATKIMEWAGKFGRFLGKLFLPITIVMSAFDFITGFMEGYKEEGIIGGLEGGLTKLFKSLIGMPLDLLTKAVSWVFEKFGWTSLSKKIDSWTEEGGFSGLIEKFIGGFFDAVKSVVDWFGKLFTDPVGTLKKLWNDTLEGAKSIGAWIGDKVLKPITLFFEKIFSWPKIEMPDMSEMLKGFAPKKDSLAWKILPGALYEMVYGEKPKPPPTQEEQEIKDRTGTEFVHKTPEERKQIEKERRAQEDKKKTTGGATTAVAKGDVKGIEAEIEALNNEWSNLGATDVDKQRAAEIGKKVEALRSKKIAILDSQSKKATPVKSGGSAIRKIDPKTIGIDWDFISKKEGGSALKGYVPDPDGSKSGVTIATGFDLGARNIKDLEGLPQDLQSKLAPYLGLQGQNAAAMLRQRPLEITAKEAKQIDKMSKGAAVNKLQREWNKRAKETGGKRFGDLSSAQQTIAASVAFQYGGLSKTPNFREAMQSGDWTKAINELNNFGDSYSTRRESEAQYLMASLDPNKKSQAFNALQTANAEGKMGGGNINNYYNNAPTINQQNASTFVAQGAVTDQLANTNRNA